MRLWRVIAVLFGGGAAVLLAALLLSARPVEASAGSDRNDADNAPTAYGYTNHATRASTGHAVDMYVDPNFNPHERDRIVSAIRQWNHVLNGYMQFNARLLPEDASPEVIARLKQSGGWIVARVDSRHAVAHQGEGRHALALTIGNGRSGTVYVISDRIGGRDLTGVVMHEFGHVLGAGHDAAGLMAPVYSAEGSRCIDRAAVSMVATAQRLPLSNLNWCVGPEYQSPPQTAGDQQAPLAWRR